jgi:hypothetical protein
MTDRRRWSPKVGDAHQVRRPQIVERAARPLAIAKGHEVAVIPTLRRSMIRLALALLVGVALALVVGWTGSEAQTTTPSTDTVTSTQTVTSTTTTTATAPTQTTTTTETKTAPGATTTIHNQTTTVQTAPSSQTANHSSSTVPTWAWVVMAVEALAIVALIFLLVRERDLRALAERRLAAPGPNPAAPGYGQPGSRYAGEQPEYPTERFDPPNRGPGPGGPPSGPNRP